MARQMPEWTIEFYADARGKSAAQDTLHSGSCGQGQFDRFTLPTQAADSSSCTPFARHDKGPNRGTSPLLSGVWLSFWKEKEMNANPNIRFEDWEAEQMRDPEFRAAVEELEPSYQIARLRILRGLTQEQLAELVGTKQSSISRLESGKTEPRLSFLRRVVEALGGRLEMRIMPQEEASAAEQPSIPVTVPHISRKLESVFAPPEAEQTVSELE